MSITLTSPAGTILRPGDPGAPCARTGRLAHHRTWDHLTGRIL